ncbi:MAG: hypothetical protein C5B55_08320 [Blastocatellia bacterium]|nr:MAG: hypothetical protein C5B55_08320 [Blastocatellia bacterium]
MTWAHNLAHKNVLSVQLKQWMPPNSSFGPKRFSLAEVIAPSSGRTIRDVNVLQAPITPRKIDRPIAIIRFEKSISFHFKA